MERITVNKSETEQKWQFEQVDPEVWMAYPPDKQAAYHAWLAGDIFGDDDEPEPERERILPKRLPVHSNQIQFMRSSVR